MHPSSQPRRANPSGKPSSSDLFCGDGGFLRDAVAFAALALFVIVVVFLSATAGELVALWRLGAEQ